MHPPLTVTVAYPRSASSRRTESRSMLPVPIPVRLGLHDERPEDREGPRCDPGLGRPRLALRRTPAQRHRFALRLALRPRTVLEIEAALRPRHHRVALPQILLVERE